MTAPTLSPLDALLEDGRRKLAEQRAVDAAAKAAREAADAARRAETFEPARQAVDRLLPKPWLGYVDYCTGNWEPCNSGHEVRVELPQAAVIAVRVHALGRDPETGTPYRWSPDAADPFRVALLVDDPPAREAYLSDRHETGHADPAVAYAVAVEREARRVELAERYAGQKARAEAERAKRQEAADALPNPAAETVAYAVALERYVTWRASVAE